MESIKHLALSEVIKAWFGWRQWHRLVHKYRKKNLLVILMPTLDRDCNLQALLYADQLIDYRNSDRTILLTIDKDVAKSANVIAKKIDDVELITDKQAQELIAYYNLYPFDQRIVIASLDHPNGRMVRGLIGKNNTTIGQVIALAIYKLPNYINTEVLADEKLKSILYATKN